MAKAKKSVASKLPVIASATVEELRVKQAEFATAIQATVDLADDESRDLTDAELGDIKAKKVSIASLEAQIEARAGVATRTGRVTSAEAAVAGNGNAIRANQGDFRVGTRATPQNQGFASFGEFAVTARLIAIGDEAAITRIRAVQTTYGNEASGSDGGFAIPPEFRAEIWNKILGPDNLLDRVSQVPCSGNSVSWPKDESTPWQTTGGILAFWESEAGVLTASKIALEMESVRLTKLAALVPISDELLEDASLIEGYLRLKAPQKIISKINTAIIRGTGVGQPSGILSGSGSTAVANKSVITVAPEASQQLNSIVYKNLVNMYSRMWAPSLGNSIWLINQDIYPQLFNLAFREDASSPFPAYMPASGLASAPFGTLFGRPVIPVEACSTLGTIGDIMFVDMSQYLALVKGGLKTDVSIHFYFDQSLTAFRFILRMNGMPLWGKSVVPENGTMTRSWAVVLDNRP